MEDVHTDGLSVVLIITLPGRMVGHHLLICTGTHLPCCLLRHCTQIVQEALKCRGRRTWVRLLRGEMRRRRALDGTALRVAQHQDEAALQRARGELQAAHHGALGMRAGVARIPQDEDVTGHGVEDGPARVSTPRLAFGGVLIRKRLHSFDDVHSFNMSHARVVWIMMRRVCRRGGGIAHGIAHLALVASCVICADIGV